ncbi:MAG: heme-binding protein [Betaproteobacteria bacterium]|nr:heme-binding protein [Betaproteobacteria bacterium]
MPEQSPLPFAKIQAAMNAMIEKVTQGPDVVVAIAIVDNTGNLLAYAQTGQLRLFSRRHAIRKAYTAAVMGMDTGIHARKLKEQGRSISELGDPQLSPTQGGLVIKRDGTILGGIGVGGFDGGHLDEALAQVGLAIILE